MQGLLEYRYDLKASREGWIYLIHAVGTCRYKIGRSGNPINRYEVLKGQSPYPLQVVSSAFSLDMVADEAALHDHYANTRVHGEWFEFNLSDPEAVYRLINYDSYESVMAKAIRMDKEFLRQFLPDSIVALLDERINIIHGRVKTYSDLLFVETLIRKEIPEHIGLTGKSPDTPFPLNRHVIWNLRTDYPCEEAQFLMPKLEIYLAGILGGAYMTLGRRSR